MKLFSAFGLDWRILLAQLINFGILLFLLYKFGYKPMFKFLEARSKKIEAGLENAEEAEKRLQAISEKEIASIKETKKEALKILEIAHQEGEENKKKTIEKTKEDIGQIINKEKQNMRAEKAEVLKDIKSEVSDLVMSALEKVLVEKIDSKKDKELIEKTIASL
jgi:F-type H+-transporting ATPase subunit b